jgi:hypothetical protein
VSIVNTKPSWPRLFADLRTSKTIVRGELSAQRP